MWFAQPDQEIFNFQIEAKSNFLPKLEEGINVTKQAPSSGSPIQHTVIVAPC